MSDLLHRCLDVPVDSPRGRSRQAHRSGVCRSFMLGMGGLLLLAGVSCKTPRPSQHAQRMAMQPVSSTAEADTTISATGGEPTSESVDEITQFLLDAQGELAKHRSARTDQVDGGATAEDAATSLVTAARVEEDPPASVELLGESPAMPAGARVADLRTPWIRSLMDQAADSDTPFRQHLTLALALALDAPGHAYEPEGINELTNEEQDLLRVFHERFQALGRELESGADAGLVLRDALAELSDLVRAEHPFRVERMELCSWVREFGDLDVIDPRTFAPNERPRFIWYLELDGVEPVEDKETGSWSYDFDVQIELLARDTGIPVIAPLQGQVTHSSSSKVNDLFLRDIFEVPQDLQYDWYTLKITVTDRQSSARAQKGVDLLWVPNLAAGAAMLDQQAAAHGGG